METSVIIILIGLFIFWGHYLEGIFERKSIPDVLGLILIGLLIGPVFNLVDPASFGQFGPIFTHFVLIFILFESGTDLKISEVKKSFGESAGITFFGFLFTWITVTLLCVGIFNLSWLTSLFIGAALGGTSAAVVVGLVKKINVRPKTAATLIMESAETDVFTLAIPLVILGLMTTGEIATNTIVPQFLASLFFSLLVGVIGAFLWSFIINRIPAFKSTKFSTPAFLFILYGIVEYLNASSPLTALSFGIAIGNLKYLEPKIIERIIPNQNILLPKSEKDFFAELVFLLRTFFFVFIGINIHINRFDWLVWGALITFILFLVRIIVVKIIIKRSTPVLDRAVMSIMIPKGLGAAVIATLPMQGGVADGEIIQSIAFSIILFSTLYCTGLFMLIKTGVTMPFYNIIFRKERNTSEDNLSVANQQTSVSSKWIQASPEIIYQAFQDPNALETWMAPESMTGKVHNFDWREGGSYEMSLYYPDDDEQTYGKTTGREDRFRSRILSLVYPTEILQAITFESGDPSFSGEMIMNVTLKEEGDGTLVTIQFSNIPPGIRPEDNEEGTRSSLEKLALYIDEMVDQKT